MTKADAMAILSPKPRRKAMTSSPSVNHDVGNESIFRSETISSGQDSLAKAQEDACVALDEAAQKREAVMKRRTASRVLRRKA